MADISDVEQTLADTVTSVLYPDGYGQSSIVGVLCRVYRGWPSPAALNADLSSGSVNVTIATDNDAGRTTTRYLSRWRATVATPGTSIALEGSTITISGIPTFGDIIGAVIDREAYAYRIQTGDSVELIASNLGQLIQTKRPVAVRGFTVTVPAADSIMVRSVRDAVASSELRRQEKDIRIICWCPTPPIRDSVAAAVDAAISQHSFLPLPDNTDAHLVYRNTASYDQAQNALLYRRDLVYTVEYPSMVVLEQPSMLFGGIGINGNTIFG